MFWTNRGDDNAELDALFRAYREACPDPEPSASFMPEIWRRIEERQRSLSFLEHWARAFATAAAVLSLGMATYLYVPRQHSSRAPITSYVEVLAAGHTLDSPEFIGPSIGEL
jgi:hypothetical protein